MNTSKYYILVDEDLVPQYPHSSTDVTKIGITANKNRRERPIVIMEGKGYGFMGVNISFERVFNENEYMMLFRKYNITWILDFIRNNPTYEEEDLKREILSHGLTLKTEDH